MRTGEFAANQMTEWNEDKQSRQKQAVKRKYGHYSYNIEKAKTRLLKYSRNFEFNNA